MPLFVFRRFVNINMHAQSARYVSEDDQQCSKTVLPRKYNNYRLTHAIIYLYGETTS